MKLKKYKNTKVKYTKANGDTSIRSIIPMYTPNNIFTLDVSDMDDETKEILINKLDEYDSFVTDTKKEILDDKLWKEALQIIEDLIGENECANLIDVMLQKKIASFEKWMDIYYPTELKDKLKWRSFIPYNISKPE